MSDHRTACVATPAPGFQDNVNLVQGAPGDHGDPLNAATATSTQAPEAYRMLRDNPAKALSCVLSWE